MRIQFTSPEKLKPLFTTDKRFNIVYGGRGSSKTYTMGEVAVMHSFLGEGKLLLTRNIQSTIDTSTKSTIETIIRKLGLRDYFEIKERYILNKVSGAQFIFAGLSKQTMENVASMDNVFFAWIDEGHTIPPEAWQRFYPSIRGKYKDGSEAKIFITFNPHRETDTFWERYIAHPNRAEMEQRNLLAIEINHHENPYFTTSSIYGDYLSDKEFMPRAYFEHIWEGKLQNYNEAPVIDITKLGRYDDTFAEWKAQGIPKPRYEMIVLSIDTAFSVKESADFSAIGIFGKASNEEVHLLRVIRGRWEFGELIQQVRYAYSYTTEIARAPDRIFIENKASGQSLIQELERSTTYLITKITPSKDKFTRVCEVLPALHSGVLRLPESGNAINAWVKPYLAELEMFRADMEHEHDDQVDITTQALSQIVGRTPDYDRINDIFENLHMEPDYGILP